MSQVSSSSSLTFATLDNLLFHYKELFSISTIVRPSEEFSFREQFQYVEIESPLTLDVDLQDLREVIELYGLMLFLHRETTSNVLLADHRMRFGICARDEVTPTIYLRIQTATYDGKGAPLYVEDVTKRATDVWQALLQLFDYDMPQPRLSNHYYKTRRTILALFGIDEAFVVKAAVRVTLNFKWSIDFTELMTNFPTSALRKLEMISPTTPIAPENESRTRLLFDQVTANMDIVSEDYQELARRAKAWVLEPDICSSWVITISSAWSRVDAASFVAMINRGHVDNLRLKVASAFTLSLAMDICAQVETVTDVTVEVKIDDEWSDVPIFPSKLKIPRSGVRMLRIEVTESPSMNMFVATMLLFLDDECSSTRMAIANCGGLHIHIIVNESNLDDYAELERLLTKVGSRVQLLLLNSYGPSDFYNEKAYAKDPDAFKLGGILAACPKLRYLNVQGAIFDDLPQLYEQEITQLQTLQVKWAPVESTMALIKALSDPNTKLAQHLIEFSTRFSTDEVLEGFAQALEKNRRIQYLRVPRRSPSDPLAIQLNSHHKKFLAPGGAAFGKFLDIMAAAGDPQAVFARECMDDDVLDTIAEFVGTTLYRQIHMR